MAIGINPYSRRRKRFPDEFGDPAGGGGGGVPIRRTAGAALRSDEFHLPIRKPPKQNVPTIGSGSDTPKDPFHPRQQSDPNAGYQQYLPGIHKQASKFLSRYNRRRAPGDQLNLDQFVQSRLKSFGGELSRTYGPHGGLLRALRGENASEVDARRARRKKLRAKAPGGAARGY